MNGNHLKTQGIDVAFSLPKFTAISLEKFIVNLCMYFSKLS